MSLPAQEEIAAPETWTGKFNRKFKENPWVPLGCLATCGALVMSAVKLRAGKSRDMNYWLRARVGLQGLTVVALLLGSTWGREWLKTNFGIEAPQMGNSAALNEQREQKKAQEKLEFEERLRNAQAMTEQEEGTGLSGGKMVVSGPKTVKKDGQSTTDAIKDSNTFQEWKKSGEAVQNSAEDLSKTR
ncbi:hypothetical protein D9613_011135 [Agrocybe pediades]|uniref:HIG1 domain-containing protein n=1 Tax=Agrocybe pediades TaxID=84607 RepID=A0A8H4VM46_9AGAR|nr:hypothetical protein D9613_011135 [Agrocybe pediades]KAF9564075.1 hypothetical protein CPC08DRAFT_705614 [Agrocybe pediades]